MKDQAPLYKDIVETGVGEKYQVSNTGVVINKRTGNPLKQRIHKTGYYVVGLYNTDDRKVYRRVSRLVAEAFVPNPDNKPQVDHIDNNRLNNHASNLQWLTASENVQKGWDSGRIHYSGSNGESGKISAYYIKHENLELLKAVKNKSQLINELLAKHFETPVRNTPAPEYTKVSRVGNVGVLHKVPEKIASGATPITNAEDIKHVPDITKVDDLFAPVKPLPEPVIPNPLPDAKDILQANMEQVCCKNELKPCQHWVWDIQTGEGHINSLSGRLMEAV